MQGAWVGWLIEELRSHMPHVEAKKKKKVYIKGDFFKTTNPDKYTSRKLASESVSRSVLSNSLQLHGLQPTRLLCPRDSPGKHTGVHCHALLQGIFPTQGLNPGLPHCRQVLYHLNHQGSGKCGEADYSFAAYQ